MKSFFVDAWSSLLGKVTIVVLLAAGLFFSLGIGRPPRKDSSERARSKLPQVSSSVRGISSEPALEQEVITTPREGFRLFKTAPDRSVDEEEAAPRVVVEPSPKLIHAFEAEVPQPKPVPPKAAELELPPGLLIPCQLFNGLESNLPDTPLIAHVIADVRINGKVAVPKGSEVHGTVRADDQRGRVMTGSSWQLVTPAGVVIKVGGIGLNREYDRARDIYGKYDGFAGIRGMEVRQDQDASKKFLAASALSAIGKISQQRNRTLFGDEVVASLGNSALEGGAAVGNEYARTKLAEMEKKKPFIRVPAGAEFYLYTQRPTSLPKPAEDPALEEALRQRERLMNDFRAKLGAARGSAQQN